MVPDTWDHGEMSNISYWPQGESEEGRNTGIVDQHGEPIYWYPDQIGFVRDEE